MLAYKKSEFSMKVNVHKTCSKSKWIVSEMNEMHGCVNWPFIWDVCNLKRSTNHITSPLQKIERLRCQWVKPTLPKSEILLVVRSKRLWSLLQAQGKPLQMKLEVLDLSLMRNFCNIKA